eukprot:Gb_18051 [translate_table: standard]
MYKKGRENIVVDALSIKDDDLTFNAISIAEPAWLTDIQNNYDEDMKKLRDDILEVKRNNKWRIKNGLILYKDMIFLTKNSSTITKVLYNERASPIAGHVGVQKIYKIIKKAFFWEGMMKDTEKYVLECDTYQR